MGKILLAKKGRYLPGIGPTFIVETGMARPATLFNGAAIASADDATFFRVVPEIGGSLTAIEPYFNTSGSTPLYKAYLFPDVDGEPTGAKYGDALASVASVVARSGAMGETATWGTPPTIVARRPYWVGIVWEQGTMQLGYNVGQGAMGSEARYTTTVADPVQNTVWRDRMRAVVPVRFRFADGSQWTNQLGCGFATAGNQGMFGDPDGANGCFNGWRFKAWENLYFLGNDFSYQAIYVDPALANGIVQRIYRLGETEPFRTSRNAVMATKAGASATTRFDTFDYADRAAVEAGDFRSLVKFHKGQTYDILGCQQGDGVDSDSSNRMAYAGAAGTQYTFDPATSADETQQNFVSMASATGKANLAPNGTTGYWGRFEFAIAGPDF